MTKKTNRGETNMGSLAERLKEQENHLNTEDKKINNVEEENKAPQATSSAQIFVNGKLDKTKSRYLSKNIHIHQGLCDEVKQYCMGMDQAVFNYLIYLGLNSVKNAEKPIMVDIKEIEKKFS